MRQITAENAFRSEASPRRISKRKLVKQGERLLFVMFAVLVFASVAKKSTRALVDRHGQATCKAR